MTTPSPSLSPLDAAAEALREVPGLKMKSLEQRREIVRVVLQAHYGAIYAGIRGEQSSATPGSF